MARRQSLVSDLRARGFDQSRQRIGERVVAVSCSQCEALVINGVACHERSCPNQTYNCKGCDATVSRSGAYCPDCA